MTVPNHLQKFTEPVLCLDKGHVRLVDLMGDDLAIVQAARTSYGLGRSKHAYRPSKDNDGELTHNLSTPR
jgi:thymidylate synthase ThyX